MYLYSGLKNNKEESSRVMLKLVDFDPEHRAVHPTAPTVEELTTYRITPERHNAYSLLWKGVTFFNVFANAALWLYF